MVQYSSACHNDPRNIDPLGKHFTVRCIDSNGVVISVRHVYPDGEELILFEKKD